MNLDLKKFAVIVEKKKETAHLTKTQVECISVIVAQSVIDS